MDIEKSSQEVKKNISESIDKIQDSALFEAAKENVWDKSKRSLARMSWFQKLFK